MSDIKKDLFAAFQEDHAELGRGLYDLRVRVEGRDSAGAMRVAARIIADSGPHVAFEEFDFYPALRSHLSDTDVSRMYDEHDRGLEFLHHVLDLPEDDAIKENAVPDMLEEIDALDRHVANCGHLFSAMSGFEISTYVHLFERLQMWRDEAPSWDDVKNGCNIPMIIEPAPCCPIVTPWPIVKAYTVKISTTERRLTSVVADRFRATIAEADRDCTRTKGVSSGWQLGPTLYFEDHRGTALVPEPSAKRFEYRMLGLANSGDLYMVSGERDAEFETEMRNRHDLGSPEILSLDAKYLRKCGDMAAACLRDKEVLNRCVQICREKGGLNIAPYQVSEHVWGLARHIAKAAASPVRVVGPSADLSRFANDKIAFSELVDALLGSKSYPPSFGRDTLAGILDVLCELADEHPLLIIKHPASAGGLGNIRVNSEEFLSVATVDRTFWLCTLLSQIEWTEGKDVLISVWIPNVFMSPSVQIWVPQRAEGDPVIEGVFEQDVKSAKGIFIGARRISLDEKIVEDVAHEAILIALTYQRLGYFGRLSLDLVLHTPNALASRIQWIEANARWGGVSIPLTISHRLTGGQIPANLTIVQKTSGAKSFNPETVQTINDPTAVRLVPKRSGLDAFVLVGSSPVEWDIWDA